MADITTPAATVPAAFTSLYDQLKNKFSADTQLLTFNPQSDSSIRSKLAAALRPAYDQQITARRQQTQQARANVDADATARGMGASTYVTDAKTRLGNAEASDVANLNSNYLATLSSQLLNRMSDQESNRLTVNKYNADQLQSAYDRAYQLALAKYPEWMTPTAGGGGGGGTRTPEEKDNGGTVNPDDWTMEEYLKYLSTLTSPKNPFPDTTSSGTAPVWNPGAQALIDKVAKESTTTGQTPQTVIKTWENNVPKPLTKATQSTVADAIAPPLSPSPNAAIYDKAFGFTPQQQTIKSELAAMWSGLLEDLSIARERAKKN